MQVKRPHLPHLRDRSHDRHEVSAAEGDDRRDDRRDDHADDLEPLPAEEVVKEAIEFFSEPYPDDQPPMHGNA